MVLKLYCLVSAVDFVLFYIEQCYFTDIKNSALKVNICLVICDCVICLYLPLNNTLS